ncbi:MAG: RnfABCDGE type electron transport complex subunit D [Flavobacteriales bacterium]|nr:RnfABCDGE type electron transport complex subunit D [Flavobacteriales bacterium]MCB9194191.1 RnfABCDGE type electron transport complex subunit D [Flavobacteriales bacterium]
MLRHLVPFIRRDARHAQVLLLATLLGYGLLVMHWSAELPRYAVLLGTCLAMQTVAVVVLRMPWSSLKSALITGLGLSLLLHVGSLLTAALAAVIAIGGKCVLRDRGKHIFNPGNLGIVLAILLTGDAWISPGQWGSGALLLVLFGSLATMLLLRVGRVDVALGFLGTFAMLQYTRTVLYLGWGMDVLVHQLMNGSLLLFTFFMITDPKTTPNAPRARLAWSMLVALVAFLLTEKVRIQAAPIWALFLVSASTPLFDRMWKAARFEWSIPLHGTSSTTTPLA